MFPFYPINFKDCINLKSNEELYEDKQIIEKSNYKVSHPNLIHKLKDKDESIKEVVIPVTEGFEDLSFTSIHNFDLLIYPSLDFTYHLINEKTEYKTKQGNFRYLNFLLVQPGSKKLYKLTF